MQYADYTSWKKWNEREFGQYTQGEAIFYQKEIEKRLKNSKSSILEFGFGNGSLLGWCRDRDFAVVGVELQSELVERAQKEGFLVANDLSEIQSLNFDMVVALDVFEHINYNDLVDVCRKLNGMLCDGGLLIARFPDGDSPFSLPHQHGDPTHVHAIGQGIARKLMLESGFNLEELKAPSETPVNLISHVKLPVKLILRELYRLFAKYAFLGSSTPSTFCINYMMIAKKLPPEQPHNDSSR